MDNIIFGVASDKRLELAQTKADERLCKEKDIPKRRRLREERMRKKPHPYQKENAKLQSIVKRLTQPTKAKILFQ